MTLTIAPTTDPSRHTFTLIYSGSFGKQERNYTLITQDASAGKYTIDEHNGIQIPATLAHNTLHSHFVVQGNRITTRYALTPDNKLSFELITYDDTSAQTTGGKTGAGGKDPIPQVLTLSPQSVQSALLTRTTSTSPATQPTPTGRAALPASPLTWLKLPTEPYRGKQDDIFFVNPSLGWYVNGAGKIFRTTNGGDTWQQLIEQKGTFFRCIAFVDKNIGIAGNIGPDYFPNVTDKVPLYRTTDGGVTWSPITTIAPDPTATSPTDKPLVGLCAIQVLRIPFVNAGNLDHKTRIVAVGRVGGPAAFIYSDDLGLTWNRLPLPDNCAMAFDVHFFDASHGLIASATSTDVASAHANILLTSDGGQTWTEAYRSSRPFELTWKISFPTRDTGYITLQSYNPDPAAADRFVLKSTDGGKSWSELPLVKDHTVRQFGIAFLDELHGFVGAMPGGFETTDGGQTWLATSFGNAVNKIRIVKDDQTTHLYTIGVSVHRLTLPTR
jgi:photosystem II stability/assembly factor-like uncharacterized protein